MKKNINLSSVYPYSIGMIMGHYILPDTTSVITSIVLYVIFGYLTILVYKFVSNNKEKILSKLSQ